VNWVRVAAVVSLPRNYECGVAAVVSLPRNYEYGVFLIEGTTSLLLLGVNGGSVWGLEEISGNGGRFGGVGVI